MPVWEIEISGGRKCYMSAQGGYPDSTDCVVWVDGDRFYEAWRRSSRDAGSRTQFIVGERSELHRDYKFHWAAACFEQSRASPVPLAQVCANPPGSGFESICFTDGITRTIWLLANEAIAFPMQIYGLESALRLHALAGAGDGPIAFVDLEK